MSSSFGHCKSCSRLARALFYYFAMGRSFTRRTSASRFHRVLNELASSSRSSVILVADSWHTSNVPGKADASWHKIELAMLKSPAPLATDGNKRPRNQGPHCNSLNLKICNHILPTYISARARLALDKVCLSDILSRRVRAGLAVGDCFWFAAPAGL